MGSATATSVIWVGHESPLLEFGAERPARRHDHCRAPNRLAPCSPGMPLPSVEPATRGLRVTANHSSCPRPWPRTRKANSRSKVRVGTTHRSTAAMASTWLRRNVRQLCEGGPRRAGSCTSKPLTSTKRFVELRGFRPDIGLDGWPLDPNHPVYSRGR